MTRINHLEILECVKQQKPIVCIDVRESFRTRTFDAGGLKMQYDKIPDYSEVLSLYNTPDRIVVVCCFNDPSGRASKAEKALRKLGFEDIRILEKGLWHGWYQKVGAKVKLPFEV